MLTFNLVFSALICALWLAVCDFVRVDAAAVGVDSGLELAWKRAVVLNDGKKYRTGKIAELGVNWQSSAVLQQGGCTYAKHKISKCYTYTLSSNTKSNLDPNGQQTNYFTTPIVTIPTSNKTTTYTYKWKFYIEPTTTSTGKSYYQLTVINSKGLNDKFHEGSSIVRFQTIGSAQGQTGIYWYENTDPSGVSTSWGKYIGKTTLHVIKLTLAKGQVGAYDYKITDASTGATLVSYKESGLYAIGDVSLLIGVNRAVVAGQSEFKAHFGDYSVVKS